MGTVLAQLIVKKASILLRDQQGRRWSPSELLGWVNDGQRDICILVPKSCTVMRDIPMVVGTKQSIPSNCIALIGIVRNVVGGAPITIIERDDLDVAAPNWHTTGADDVVLHYTFDGRVPKSWYCYPPQANGGRLVEAAVQENPVDCTISGVDGGSTSTAIHVDDVYQTALIEYVCHRAYEKNAETRDVQKAGDYYAAFARRLGMKVVVDAAANPNRNAPPAQQSRQAGGVSQRARAD